MNTDHHLLVGPSLKTLTPAQLEEIACLAKPGIIDDLDENDGPYNANEAEDEVGQRSLHPKYKFIYSNKDADDEPEPESISFYEWTTGMSDCGMESDTYEWTIRAGEVFGPMGDCWAVLPVVKWFLDHGWRWADSEIPEARS